MEDLSFQGGQGNETLRKYIHGEDQTWTYNVIGATMLISSLVALPCNSVMIHVYFNSKNLHTTTNNFIVTYIFLCLLISVIGYPQLIAACFAKRWLFGYIGCQIDGFLMTFLGISSISLLVAVSVDRYFIVVHPRKWCRFTRKYTIWAYCLCFGMGLFWAVTPILGWNFYSLDFYRLSCAPSWNSRHGSDLAYSMVQFTTVLFLPLTGLTYCYTAIVAKVYKQRRRKKVTSSNLNREIQVAMTLFLAVCSFLLSWTPYAVFSIYSCFADLGNVHPLVGEIPALFAKASCLWNPLVYVYNHGLFRKEIINTFRRAGEKGRILCAVNVTSYKIPCSQKSRTKITDAFGTIEMETFRTQENVDPGSLDLSSSILGSK